MEEAKDLGMSSVCAVSDEPNIEDIKSGKFHLIFGSAENVLDKCSVEALNIQVVICVIVWLLSL